jgi:iron complex outermembrane receptor protein
MNEICRSSLKIKHMTSESGGDMASNTKPTSLKAVLYAGSSFVLAFGGMTTQTRAQNVVIEEVTVTATRRAEPLQSVPIAVSVVTGDRLREASLNNLRDVASEVPALNFRTAASNKDQALFLRGLGTVSTSPGVEPSVSTVLDGVVLARQGQATLDLLDIERLEVLRGPQGTLFGKNASAGVLNIVSKKPTFDTTGFLDASAFTGGEYRVRAGVSGELLPEKVAASVSVLGSSWRGNVENVFDNTHVNGAQKLGGRVRLLFVPADDVEIVVTGDHVWSKDDTPQGVVTRTSLIAFPTNAVSTFPAFGTAIAPVVPTDESRTINSNYDTHATDRNSGVSAELNAALGDHDFTSITAWRGWHNTQYQDQDRLPRPLAAFPQQHDVGRLTFNQYSQEVRLASPKNETFDYVVGAFYFEGHNRETYARDTITVAGTTQTLNRGVANYGVVNKNFAVFGESNAHITDQLNAIAGLRWVRDALKFDFARTSTSAVAVPGIQTAFTANGNVTSKDVAGRGGLQFAFTPSAMVYATYSRGYKGPAYNPAFSMLPQDTLALKPETSDSYEAGFKTTFWNGQLQFNAAGFLQKLQNYQVPFFDSFNGSPITRLINAGRVSTRGFEGDLTARLSDQFLITGALTYTDAQIDEFTCPVGTTASCNVNGYTLPYAPEWRGSLRANWTAPLSDDLDLLLSTDVNWRTETQYSINQTADTIEDGYAIWNASAGVGTRDGWKITAVVKNITDRSYSPFLTRFGSGVVRFVPRDDSRYVGIIVLKDF